MNKTFPLNEHRQRRTGHLTVLTNVRSTGSKMDRKDNAHRNSVRISAFFSFNSNSTIQETKGYRKPENIKSLLFVRIRVWRQESPVFSFHVAVVCEVGRPVTSQVNQAHPGSLRLTSMVVLKVADSADTGTCKRYKDKI
ncbi:hypothetical protein CBL_13950 [Carabus blaptoides fortunei]